MKLVTRLALSALVCVCVGRSAPVDAHRLDEYLQATRIAVDRDRVTVELDLTPGVVVAPSIVAMIDRDRNGEITDAEGEEYARHVIEGLVVHVDGRPVRARLDGRALPIWRDLAEGTGVIRLTASATFPRVASGRHQVYFRNMHRPEVGVYLANALVPVDDRVEITSQRRDPAQHELTIDFSVRRAAHQLWAVLAGFIVAGTIGLVSVRRRPASRIDASPRDE